MKTKLDYFLIGQSVLQLVSVPLPLPIPITLGPSLSDDVGFLLSLVSDLSEFVSLPIIPLLCAPAYKSEGHTPSHTHSE